MDSIEVIEDGYEIIISIIENIPDEGFIEASAYYKDFDLYRILILADTVDKAVKLATQELLTNHPFEKIIENY